MSYLKMALAALQATTSAGEVGGQRCGFTSQAPNHNSNTETAPVNPEARPVTCAAECPWYELNPWTRDPALGAWCHYRMEPLAGGSPTCEEFRRGEVPSRHPYKQVPATIPPAPPESAFTCADCLFFSASCGPNPQQAWGRCLKRGRGRYGCGTACEAALTDDEGA